MSEELEQKLTERFDVISAKAECDKDVRDALLKAYLAGGEYGYQYALQHPQWIPVKERLPEETEVVLGVREGGTDVEMYKFMGFNESTNTFDWEWHPYYRAVVDDVTHWMKIQPPRKEE